MNESILLTGVILVFWVIGLLQGLLIANGLLKGWFRRCISFFIGSLVYISANLFLSIR